MREIFMQEKAIGRGRAFDCLMAGEFAIIRQCTRIGQAFAASLAGQP